MKTIQTVVVAFTLGVWSGIPALAFAPSTNGSGVTWVSESGEGWTGNAQTNGSGSTVHLAGAFDQSVDTSSGVGVTAYVGLLDPIALLLVTPTPSPIDTEPVISTPTITPTGTFLTLTPTHTCLITEGSYDLTGDGVVDAEDLIALLTSIREGTSLYDFNCDGITDERDLQAFSAKWRVTP